MKKLIFTTAALIGLTVATNAQNTSNASSNASQAVQLALSNAIEIGFTNTGNATGNAVTMAFTSANDYANGVESAEQELKVRSNKEFKVGVKIDLNSFNYTGPGNLNLATVPMNAFALKVANNNTGGNIAAPFTTSSFSTLTGVDQNLIVDGDNGGDQKFAIKYKCTPGFSLPAGTYTFNVVYTATQQ